MTTFKQYLTEAKKAITREQAVEFFKDIKRAINPEMVQPHVYQNGDWWEVSIRDYEFFTPRPGEEDDDHPDFTGGKRLEKILKSILKGVEFEFSPEEKSWISISMKAKPLNKKQLNADAKKLTQSVLEAVRNERFRSNDRRDREFFEELQELLKKWKKKFIKKEDYMTLQNKTKWGDEELALEAWFKAK
jgi:hemerythrin